MPVNGIVRTARGIKLNIAELVARANAPLSKDPTSEITPRVVPKKRVLNVRGNRPALMQEASEAAHAAMRGEQVVVLVDATPVGTSGEKAKTLADLTGIKITTERNKNAKKGLENVNQALDDILGDLTAKTANTSGIKPEDLVNE